MLHHATWRQLSLASAMLALMAGCSSEPLLDSLHPGGRTRQSTSSSNGEWSPTGGMAASRLLHAAASLPDGRVLVVGGYNRSAEIYSPISGAWASTSNALNTHRAATATLLPSGKVLVVGVGGAEWNSGISSEVYDPDTGTWAITGNPLTPRLYHTATLLQNGRVLVVGGANAEFGGMTLASAELYDPETGTWTGAGSMMTARHHHTATQLGNGKVLFSGGTGADGLPLRNAEVFDPANGSWTLVGEMAVARTFHSVASLPDDRVLVTGGGSSSWDSSASAELFNPATGTWTAAAPMSRPRRHHSATPLPDGKVLVTGGFHEYTGIHAIAEVYNPDTGEWLDAGSMGAARYLHTATLLKGGKVLIAGGASNGDQSSAELFIPFSAPQGPLLTVEAGSDSLEIMLNERENVTTVLNLTYAGGGPLIVVNEVSIEPNNGGLTLMSDYPGNGFRATGSVSFVLNQSLRGLLPGIYRVTNRATVIGTSLEASDSFIVHVLPAGGAPVIMPLGAWPDAIPASGSSEVTFTATVARYRTPPDQLFLRRVESTGAPIVATMLDNGTGGDLMAGDGVYSATLNVVSGTASLIRYKATSSFPGVQEEKHSTLFDLSVSCHPIKIQPYLPSKIVTDPATGARLLCDEVLVSFADGIACGETASIITQLLGPGAEIIGSQPGLGFYQIRLPGSCSSKAVHEALETLQSDTRISQATANFVGEADEFTPNDPRYSEQYIPRKIRADEAWVIARGSSVIAVVDSGIDFNEPDLLGQVLLGRDFFNDDADPSDDLGHGTKVASIIAAKGNNAEGLAGVAWGSKVLAVKAISDTNSISTSGGAAAIKYAADRGAKVINCSWGFPGGLRPVDTSILQAAIDYATSKGSLVVASSGNAGTTHQRYPCAYPDALCVAATTASDTRWNLSNHGSHVDISAPGADVLVAHMGGGYGTDSGTSFSAAWVSGSASVVWSHKPSWTAEQVRQRIQRTAVPLLSPGLGSGRIDLFEAVFNGSFEDGVTGWRAQGTAGALGNLGALLPQAQDKMSFLSSGPDEEQIETTLDQDFTVQPGVTSIPLTFDYNFVTEEYPEYVGTEYNDNIRIVLSAPNGAETLLAYESVNSSQFSLVPGIDFPGGDHTVGATGWKTVNVRVPVTSGPGRYRIRVRDEGDGIYDSNLLLDNIRFR